MQSYFESRLAIDESSHNKAMIGSSDSTVLPQQVASSVELTLLSVPAANGYDHVGTSRWVNESEIDTSCKELSSTTLIPSRTTPSGEKIRAYLNRVEELRGYVAQEGSVLNLESEYDFWMFVLSEPRIQESNLVVTDEENLRMVWRTSGENHLALEFLGGGEIQFVIFKRRTSSQWISRVAGRDNVKGVRCLIDTFGLDSLLYG